MTDPAAPNGQQELGGAVVSGNGASAPDGGADGAPGGSGGSSPRASTATAR